MSESRLGMRAWLIASNSRLPTRMSCKSKSPARKAAEPRYRQLLKLSCGKKAGNEIASFCQHWTREPRRFSVLWVQTLSHSFVSVFLDGIATNRDGLSLA